MKRVLIAGVVICSVLSSTCSKKNSEQKSSARQQAPVVAVSACAGQDHNLVVSFDGILYGSGKNEQGQMGTGNTESSKVFVEIATDVKDAFTGPGYSFIVKKDGSLWATGSNQGGPFGTGNTTSSYSFIKLQSDVKSVVAGELFSLILKDDGTLMVSGRNESYLTKNFTTLETEPDDASNFFVKVLEDVKEVSVGMRFNCLVVKNDGTLLGTGENVVYLPAGNSVNVKSQTQPFVTLMMDVKSACAGGLHSMVIKNDGTLWAAGQNKYGQLGTGDNQDRVKFEKVLTDVAAISCGYNQTYALKNNGTLWATGGLGRVISPQYNLDDITDRNSFVQVMSDVSYISAGWIRGSSAESAIAIKKDGTVWVIGANGYGALGIGIYEDREDWVQVMK